MKLKEICRGFTLIETLIAVSIFAVVSMTTALLYTQSFRAMRMTNTQDQIYEDARFILERISELVRDNMVDYDEYYSQNVIIGGGTPKPSGAPDFGAQNFGQNYGRYFSAFFNPGADAALGHDCNDAHSAGTIFNAPDPARSARRNLRDCTTLNSTRDRFTGSNPFDGKYPGQNSTDENAFCSTVTYQFNAKNNKGISPPTDLQNMCANGLSAVSRKQPELYLISADGRYKTILAREKIDNNPAMYALSMFKMEGTDGNGDGIYDSFACAAGYQCTGQNQVVPCIGDKTLPPKREDSLSHKNDLCDSITNSFAYDFVPISPFRTTIQDLAFFISPLDNPYYAFSEDNQQTQPRVTIMLTIAPNPTYVNGVDSFSPITLVETVTAGVRKAVPAPELTL